MPAHSPPPCYRCLACRERSVQSPIPDILLCTGAGLALALATAGSARAQVPISSSYSTRDGRIVSYTLACVSTDGSFTAQPCGVNGYPLQVSLSGGLALPAGAATAALQPALNADGGAQIHIQNLPATQVVSNAGAFAVQDAQVIAATAALITNTAARSGAWTDASFTATATSTSPSGLAGVSARTGLHVWNLGAATVCLNYTAPASASGSGCATGSVPIMGGSAYLEDQPGNVSPEAISLVCTVAACPLTIKVR